MSEFLLYERNSAFNHSLWHRWEYLTLMSMSPRLLQRHEEGYMEIGYSLVQDAYYALKGSTPNASKVGKIWAEVMQQEYFPTLQDQMKTMDGKINTVLFLARKFWEWYMKEDKKNPPPPKQATPKQNVPQFFEIVDDDDLDEDDSDSDDDIDFDDDEMRGDIEDDDSLDNIDEAFDELSQQAESEEGGDVEADDQAGPQFGAVVVAKKQVMVISNVEIEQLESETETYQVMGGLKAGDGAGPREIRKFTEDMFKLRDISPISDLIGWASRVMDGAKRANIGATGTMVGYGFDTLTNSTHPLDRYEVISGSVLGRAKLASRQLRTHKYDEERPSGKGSVVYCPDESGSMSCSSYEEDGKHNKQLNLQLSLAHLFMKEERPFTTIAWDSDQTRMYEYGKPGLQAHIEEFLGGGTRITHVLYKALNHIKQNETYRDNADILFVSDGEIGDYPNRDLDLMEKVKEYKERGGRIWFAFVGGNVRETSPGQLTSWVDFMLSIDDFYDEKKLSEVLAQMARDHRKHESYEL